MLIDRKIPGIFSDCVLVDNEKAAERAVDLLFEKGHRNIGLIGGPREIYTAQERLRGYCNAHKKRSIPVQESLVYHGDYTMQGGVRALEDLVKRNPHMTAVFVVNYEMTMGAVIGVNELGIKIPRELSLVGFDTGSCQGMQSQTYHCNPAYPANRPESGRDHAGTSGRRKRG